MTKKDRRSIEVVLQQLDLANKNLAACQACLAGEVARHTEVVSALDKLLELAQPRPNQPKEYYDEICSRRDHTVQRARNAIRAYEMDGGRL